jgi:hypothetical protein
MGAAMALSACGGGTVMPDAGPPLILPAAMADTDGDPENGAEAAANFGCVGTRSAPAAGAVGTFTGHFYDFQTDTTNVTAAMVEVYSDNVVAGSCGAGCMAYTTDAAGDAQIMLAQDAWFAYRVASNGTYVTTIGYNRGAPAAGGTIQLPVVAQTTLNFIPMLYRRTRVPGTGVVAGELTDCDGNSVEGAIVRLFRDGVEVIPGTGMMDYFAGYFGEATGLPDARADNTTANGLYAAANVAATTDLVRIELWATETEGGSPMRVACEAIQVAADAVSVISVGPTRGDYPAGHPCAE